MQQTAFCPVALMIACVLSAAIRIILRNESTSGRTHTRTVANLPHSLGGRLVPYITNVRLSSNPLRLIARLLFCAGSNIETKGKQTASSLLQTRTPFKACAVCKDSSAQAPKTAADFLQNPQLAQKS